MLPPPLPPPTLIASEHRHSVSYSTSILVIAALLSFAIVVIASIHLLLRYLSCSRSPPPIHRHHDLSSSSSMPMTSSSPTDPDPKAVVDSLPIVSSSSSMAAGLDCAVCLSPFGPRDRIRLLPSCRHAFHSRCIDTWLRSTLSCPLCRSSVLPSPPPPPPPAAAAEIGSVSSSSRRSEEAHPPLGHSFEYVADEEVDAVLSRIRRAEKSEAAAPPGDAVAEVAGGGGSRSWLREYVDRLASSASTRWSRRYDSGNGGGGGENWDLERNVQLHLEEEDDGGFSSFYRWLVGV